MIWMEIFDRNLYLVDIVKKAVTWYKRSTQHTYVISSEAKINYTYLD